MYCLQSIIATWNSQSRLSSRFLIYAACWGSVDDIEADFHLPFCLYLDKIDREFGSNIGASREDKIAAIKRTIKSLPLSKEDSEDLTKTIQAANWLGVDSTARKKKSKLKPRHKHRRED